MWLRPDVLIQPPKHCPLTEAQARLILRQHGAQCPVPLLRNRYVVHGLGGESAQLRVEPDSEHDGLTGIALHADGFHRSNTRLEVFRWCARLAAALGWQAAVGRTGEPLSATGEILPLAFRSRVAIQAMHFGVITYVCLGSLSAAVAYLTGLSIGDTSDSAWPMLAAITAAFLTCGLMAVAIPAFRAREHWNPASH